jgi:hypothetical protein
MRMTEQLWEVTMSNENCFPEKALDAKARRAARREGLLARKSRRTGGFMLIEPYRNIPFGGDSDLSAEEVIEYCSDDEA